MDAKVSANIVYEIYQGCFTRKGQMKDFLAQSVREGIPIRQVREKQPCPSGSWVSLGGKFNTGVCSFVTFASLLGFLFWWLLVSSIIFFGFLCKLLLCAKLQLFIDKIHTTNSGRFRKL